MRNVKNAAFKSGGKKCHCNKLRERMPQLKGSHVFLIVLAESFPQNAVHSVLSTAGLQPSNKRASRYSAQVDVCAPFPLSRLRQGSGSRGPGYEQAGRWSPLPRQPDPPCPAASQTGSGRFTPPYCKPVRSNYSPALGMDKAAPQITNLIYRLWPATLLEAARPSSRREAES